MQGNGCCRLKALLLSIRAHVTRELQKSSAGVRRVERSRRMGEAMSVSHTIPVHRRLSFPFTRAAAAAAAAAAAIVCALSCPFCDLCLRSCAFCVTGMCRVASRGEIRVHTSGCSSKRSRCKCRHRVIYRASDASPVKAGACCAQSAADSDSTDGTGTWKRFRSSAHIRLRLD